MLNSSVLEVVVGLFLVFFVFAAICSGVVEWISRLLRLRADYLLRGLRHMLDGAGKTQRQEIQPVASTAGATGDPGPAAPDAASQSAGGVADRLLRLPVLATFGQQVDG